MFSFFDPRTGEVPDLHKLIIEIRNLLVEVSDIFILRFYFDSAAGLGGFKTYIVQYEMFANLFMPLYTGNLGSVELLTNLMGDLKRIFLAARSLDSYMDGFAELQEDKSRFITESCEALDFKTIKSIYDESISKLKPKFEIIKDKVARYIHHLLFLQVNYVAPENSIFAERSKGYILSDKIVTQLFLQGLGVKLNVETAIIEKHNELFAEIEKKPNGFLFKLSK